MRNLVEYPITAQEITSAIERWYTLSVAIPQGVPCGCTDGQVVKVLRMLLKDNPAAVAAAIKKVGP